jgi:5-methylcytosine-specific restriction endonuclease McrA
MNWEKLRYQVLQRDGYICQICLKKLDKLDIHHIIPKRRQGLNSINNLTSVCEVCHNMIELHELKNTKGTMIKVKEDTYERLTKRGSFGETFDDIIRRLLDLTEVKSKK